MSKQHFGWEPNPEGVERLIQDSQVALKEMPLRWGKPVNTSDKKPIVLLNALLALEPDWMRGAQGIGDCVSWGHELGCTVATAVDIVIKGAPWLWPGVYATEPIYGGSRVEAQGRSRGGWMDGSYGGAATKWVLEWGCLNRKNYSLATGNSSHDLRTYSSKKAKNWGNYGCGGQGDIKLDNEAKNFPAKEAWLTTTFEQAVASIEAGYPVPVASGQGLGKRNKDGFAPAWGSWAHEMCFVGVRYDIPGLLICNSWGNSWGTSAPLPGVTSRNLKRSCAWVYAKTANRMLAQRDSYTLTGNEGLTKRKIDWKEGWHIEGR